MSFINLRPTNPPRGMGAPGGKKRVSLRTPASGLPCQASPLDDYRCLLTRLLASVLAPLPSFVHRVAKEPFSKDGHLTTLTVSH